MMARAVEFPKRNPSCSGLRILLASTYREARMVRHEAHNLYRIGVYFVTVVATLPSVLWRSAAARTEAPRSAASKAGNTTSVPFCSRSLEKKSRIINLTDISLPVPVLRFSRKVHLYAACPDACGVG